MRALHVNSHPQGTRSPQVDFYMYILQSTSKAKDWQAETLPMPLAVADKLVRQRIAQASGCRRYRLVKVRVA